MSQLTSQTLRLSKRRDYNPLEYAHMQDDTKLYRYAAIANDVYRNNMIAIAEDMANIFGAHLIPTRCLHWEFRGKVADRRVKIGRDSYYALKKSEVPPKSWEKYISEIERSNAV